MKASRRLFLAATFVLAALPGRAAEPFVNFNVVLLQPSKVLEERVSVDAMAEYIKAVEAAAREALVASPARQATGGFLVLAVRPGRQSRVWLDFDAMLDLGIRKQLTTRLLAVPPFEARQGPVVFALKVGIWGGKEPRRTVPMPAQWKQASKGDAPREVGELVESIWGE